MASGYGYTGGRSRCHAFWQDFQMCYAGADAPEDCKAQAEDYLECLHHKKEISRAMQVKAQFLSSTAHEIENKRKQVNQVSDSGILGLGLLRQPEEDEEEETASKDESGDTKDGSGDEKESTEGESDKDGDDDKRQV